jgi:hypothetical protein
MEKSVSKKPDIGKIQINSPKVPSKPPAIPPSNPPKK